MTKPQPVKDDSARSPFAGCFILIAGVCVMIFLIGFSVLTLFRQFNEIAKFTAEQPTPVETTTLENRESELNTLAERVETFRQQLAGDTETSLALSPEDINLAIAAYEPFKELRGTFRITSIEGDTLRAAISFPLNGKPRFTKEGESGLIASDSRYLNATLVGRPELQQREIVFSISKVEVPGVQVPQEFTDQMSPYRLTERYLTDETIGPVMAKLTRVGIVDGKIVLTRKPGEVPAHTITNEQVDKASTRLFTALGVAASLFLALAATIVFIGMRAKARKERNS